MGHTRNEFAKDVPKSTKVGIPTPFQSPTDPAPACLFSFEDTRAELNPIPFLMS